MVSLRGLCDLPRRNILTQGQKRTNKDLMIPNNGASMTATEFLHQIPVVAPERCPLCDSPITRKQFLDVESRIREQEKKKLEEQRRGLEDQRRKLDEENRVKMEAFR